MQAVDLDTGQVLACDLSLAESFYSRLRGLLGRRELAPGGGLWIRPCNSVHTFGMKFSIDVAFLDSELRVVAVAKTLAPYRVSRVYSRAASVLELPAGTLDAAATAVGARIEIT